MIGIMTSQPASSTRTLDSKDCWRLLRDASVGRLAVWLGDRPDIFPVNFVVDHGTVVFRTGPGTKLHAALGDTPVAFEADGVIAGAGAEASAWSVVVHGQATAVQQIDELIDTFSLELAPWESGHKDSFVRITAEAITGRWLPISPAGQWRTAEDNPPHAADE